MGIASDIMNLGSDQLKTQFDIIFPKGIPGGGNVDLLSMRADMQLDLPERTVGQYDIFKKGVKIPKLNMVQETEKSFTIEFRLDQEWEVWKALDGWSKMSYDHSTGTALPESATRTDIYVLAEDQMNATVQTIKMIDSKLKSLKLTEFDNQGTDPVRVTAVFIFNDMDFS